MDRPKIQIELQTTDWVIEIIGAIFLLLMLGTPLFFFEQLPQEIPSHYNALGVADAFSQKSTLLILPVTGLIMYIGLFTLNRYPHVFNYLNEINEENAARQYRIATKLVRTLNMVIAGSFFYLSYNTVMIGLGVRDNLGPIFLPVFMLSIFGVIGIYLYQAFRK